jgi:hypothetical protein
MTGYPDGIADLPIAECAVGNNVNQISDKDEEK